LFKSCLRFDKATVKYTDDPQCITVCVFYRGVRDVPHMPVAGDYITERHATVLSSVWNMRLSLLCC